MANDFCEICGTFQELCPQCGECVECSCYCADYEDGTAGELDFALDEAADFAPDDEMREDRA